MRVFFCEFTEDWWLESPDFKAIIPSGTGEVRLWPPAVWGQIIPNFYLANQVDCSDWGRKGGEYSRFISFKRVVLCILSMICAIYWIYSDYLFPQGKTGFTLGSQRFQWAGNLNGCPRLNWECLFCYITWQFCIVLHLQPCIKLHSKSTCVLIENANKPRCFQIRMKNKSFVWPPQKARAEREVASCLYRLCWFLSILNLCQGHT